MARGPEGDAAISLSSDTAIAFCLSVFHRLDVNWELHGFDTTALRELAEMTLRTLQSLLTDPGQPPRDGIALRFFFSSRRRHTSLTCDWSSDVCSSDLVVDGGSDAGIMRAAGRAWRSTRCPQPLVGVMARGTIATPDASGTRKAGTSTAPVEPNHSHLVIVPGERWGDERPWLLAVAATLSGARPSAMLLVNGGPLARREALEAAALGVRVLALRGSGRVADELADAVDRGEPVAGPGGVDVRERIRAVDGEVQA